MNAQEKISQIVKIGRRKLDENTKLRLIRKLSKTDKTENRSRRSIDDLTLNLLYGNGENGTTIQEIVKYILESYPEKNPDTIVRTTKRRLTSYFKTEKNINVLKRTDENGTTFYRISSETETETETVKETSPEFIPSLIILP